MSTGSDQSRLKFLNVLELITNLNTDDPTLSVTLGMVKFVSFMFGP